MVRQIWDVITGAAERREIRESYLRALEEVASASRAQTEMIHDWLRSFNTQGDPVRGWAMSPADEWLQEQKDEHPERFTGMPAAIEGDEAAQIDWLTAQVRDL